MHVANTAPTELVKSGYLASHGVKEVLVVLRAHCYDCTV